MRVLAASIAHGQWHHLYEKQLLGTWAALQERAEKHAVIAKVRLSHRAVDHIDRW